MITRIGMGLSVVAGLIANVGCGSSSSNPDAAPTFDAAPPSVLEGTWKTTCNTTGGQAPGANSSNATLTFTGSAYSFVQANFSDAACATPILALGEAGTFVVGSADTVLTAATDITFTQSAATATPSGGEAAMLNVAGTGGTSICKAAGGASITFTDGTATSIAGATCGGGGGGGGSNGQTANGTSLINIFEITTGTMLQIGSGANDSLGTISTGTRPSTLDTNTTFIKQ